MKMGPRRASTGSFLRLVSKSNKTSNKTKDMLSASFPGRKPTIVEENFVPLKSCLSVGKNLSHMKKNVSFHTIEIREHARALGDNPSVSSGPALSVGWASVNSMHLLVEDYEQHRPPRRCRSSLAVPRKVREQMLRDEGVTRTEMEAANRTTTRIKQSRNQAARGIHHPKLPFKAIAKMLKGTESSTDRQVEALLLQSVRAEQARQGQKDAYLAAQRDERLKAEQDHQSPGQSTEETGCLPLIVLAETVSPPLPVGIEEPKDDSTKSLPADTEPKDDAPSTLPPNEAQHDVRTISSPVGDLPPPPSSFLPATAVLKEKGDDDDAAEEWEF
jgi:hypothetical protein